MDTEMVTLSEAAQTETDKHHVTSHTGGIFITTQMSSSTKPGQNPRHGEQKCGCQGRGRLGKGQRVSSETKGKGGGHNL